MTAELLQDALNHLPADLVAQADAWRSRGKKRVIHWKRWAAMAACLALVLFAGRLMLPNDMKTESAADTAAQAPEAPLTAGASPREDAPAAAAPACTDGAAANGAPAGDPPPAVYYGEARTPLAPAVNAEAAPRLKLITSRAELDAYLEASAFDTGELRGLTEGLDAQWFQNQDLLLAALPGAHDFGGAELTAGILELRLIPRDSEPLVWHHFAILVVKGELAGTDDVTLILE